MAKTATRSGVRRLPHPQYRGPLRRQMVPAGALQPAHGRASALFGDTPPDDRHLAEDARLDPAAARTGRPAFAHGLPRSAAARRIRPHAPRRIAHAPSRLAHRLGTGKFRRRSSATATPCKQPDRIYKSRTRNRQAAGFGPSRSPQPSPPHRPPSQMPRQSVPATVPERVPSRPRQTRPTNAPGGAMSAPNRKSPFRDFFYFTFSKT